MQPDQVAAKSCSSSMNVRELESADREAWLGSEIAKQLVHFRREIPNAIKTADPMRHQPHNLSQ